MGQRVLINETDQILSPPGASSLVGEENNRQNNAVKLVVHQMGIKAELEIKQRWGGRCSLNQGGGKKGLARVTSEQRTEGKEDELDTYPEEHSRQREQRAKTLR